MIKRFTTIFIAICFVVAFVPATDATLQKGNPYDAFDQFIAIINAMHDFEGLQLGLRMSASLEGLCKLPIALPASAAPRAPPA